MSHFVHLHVHSEYSLLDGACRIEGLVARAAELGQTAVAITDHGVMYGVVDFYKAAKKAGIHPVIGCEVYVAARSRFDKVHGTDSEHAHLVLLCENDIGYHNLIKLVSAAWTEGFYSRPRVDHELLAQYSEGLIALSACLAGEIPRALREGDYAKAKQTAQFYAQLFGRDHFYLELQDHGLHDQKMINPLLMRLAGETEIPLICTNDVHYLTREDAEMQKVLLCIQTGTTVDEPSGMAFETQEFYLKSEAEMRALFPGAPAAFDNTAAIAARCQVTLPFGELKLPTFDAPGGDSTAYFEQQCREGFSRRYGDTPSPAAQQRLAYELATVRDMGYVDYYLIVNDFVQFAKTHDIPVGPGRGSGAGSLCAYCLGITDIDPLQYDLLFERFLNPERVSMPDFDVDFCTEKRQQVIDYVIAKYGADRVAQIITFGTMAARAAIRDVARALGMPYATGDRVAKLVPWDMHMTLEKAIEQSKEFRACVEENPQIHRLVDMARKVEGMPRNASTHAAGVVIAPRPVSDFVPVCVNSDVIATQYPMNILEELGLLKMDFLGLRNLTVIADAVSMIRKKQPDFAVERISLSDHPVYEMLSEGNSDGVFQMESAGLKRVLVQMAPDCFEDLIAVISLYRPGPMESIPKYIRNRQHPEQIRYLHPLLKPILQVTYGCMVYQEQVMQVFRQLAGYSLGRADVVRRAMSKKKHDVMQKEREIFINGLTDAEGTVLVEGCVRRGISAQTAQAVFEEMASFASYAFNKSHAAAYAKIAYQTAWLKCFHPREYMAALLTSVLFSGKVVTYMDECARLGIRVLPPSVNESESGFTVTKEGIRFGLLAVKNLGRGLIAELVRERTENGVYRHFVDFCTRLSPCRECTRRSIDSLIRCGALDGLGANRNQMLMGAEMVLSRLEDDARRQVSGQLDFFTAMDIPTYTLPELPELPYDQLLAMEKEVTGLYLSGHPLAPYAPQYKNAAVSRIDHVLAALEEGGGGFADGTQVQLLGLVQQVHAKTTRSGDRMAYVELEDLYGSMELLVFPKPFAQYGHLLQAGQVVLVHGRLQVQEEEPPRLLCDRVAQADPPPVGNMRHGVYLRLPGMETPLYTQTGTLLARYSGEEPVYIRLTDTGKLMKAPPAWWTSPTPACVEDLQKLLGIDNVAVIPL